MNAATWVVVAVIVHQFSIGGPANSNAMLIPNALTLAGDAAFASKISDAVCPIRRAYVCLQLVDPRAVSIWTMVPLLLAHIKLRVEKTYKQRGEARLPFGLSLRAKPSPDKASGFRRRSLIKPIAREEKGLRLSAWDFSSSALRRGH